MRITSVLLMTGIFLFLNSLAVGQKVSTVQPKTGSVKTIQPANQPKPAVTKKPEKAPVHSVVSKPSRSYYQSATSASKPSPRPINPPTPDIPEVTINRFLNNNLGQTECLSMSHRRWMRYSSWAWCPVPRGMYLMGVEDSTTNQAGQIQFVNETGLSLDIYLKPIGDVNSKSAMTVDYNWIEKRSKPDYVLSPGEAVTVKVAIDKGIAYSARTKTTNAAAGIYRRDGKVFFNDEIRKVVFE